MSQLNPLAGDLGRHLMGTLRVLHTPPPAKLQRHAPYYLMLADASVTSTYLGQVTSRGTRGKTQAREAGGSEERIQF